MSSIKDLLPNKAPKVDLAAGEGHALSQLILKTKPDERRPYDAGYHVELRREAPTRQIDGEPADDGGRYDVSHLAPPLNRPVQNPRLPGSSRVISATAGG